ncbi:S9 family peptidase [Ideonella sp. A 288]|uniref:alpha/beta hydrolase family protein n=1 Tax=Ideonella sp. A 288 TaxID=1962181 RepID=UPI000B4BB69F|nr:prolyl oligopeptidase family serine peptidase [Ideonella sp. A 288]
MSLPPIRRAILPLARRGCLRAWALGAAMALAGLAGCGGGGSDPVPVPPPPPVVITGPGTLKESTQVAALSLADIAAAWPGGGATGLPAAPRYAVDAYRLTYLTTDGQGREVTASGLVAVPRKAAGVPSPVLGYQHGTTFRDAEAPSNRVIATEPPLALASLGYLVVAADYVGYGASKGQAHPYLQAAPTAAAVVDFLTAARTWRQREGVADNGQLFLAGYSEGGYATVAAHRALQAAGSSHLAQLQASVAGAGPLDVTLTLNTLLERVRRDNPLIAGLISPGLLRNLGSTVRAEVRRQLVRAAVPDDADVRVQADFIDRYLADDTAALDRDSNVHDWAPAAPLWLFHGRDDQTVPYGVSTHALQAMRARGATGVALDDCAASPSSHLGCVAPYFAFLLSRLSGVARDL